MRHQIEAILFDMGGTLRSARKQGRTERLKFIAEILLLLGSDADPGKFSRLLARRSTAYRRWARQTMIELNEVDLWVHWLLPDWPATLVREHALQLNSLWRQATAVRVIFPETPAVLVELFRRGYRLGLVSNTTSSTEAPQALDEIGLTCYLETIILSSVVGKRKPDPDILLEATRRMDIEPLKCAYVGDLPHRDVAAARQAGFSKTILIHNRYRRLPIPVEDSELEPDHHIRNLTQLLELFPARAVAQPETAFAVSISTMWAIKNFSALEDFLEAGKRIGFGQCELNHQVDSAMLDRIKLNAYSFSTVHEPCPADIPEAVLKKRDWLISSTDEHCRREGVKSIQRSIDLAARLNARAIVIHAGSVHPNRSLEDRLRRFYQAGQYGSEAYQALKRQMIEIRQDFAPAHLAAVKKSLVELLDYARQKPVRLGLENRYHYLEYPSPDELEGLLELASPDRLGFIYDVGHAQVLSQLGFFPQVEWLQRFSSRIIGVHLHDVSGLSDHRLPGHGEVDFDLIAAYLPKDAFRTLEFQGYLTHEQVKAGLRHLEQHGCIWVNDH